MTQEDYVSFETAKLLKEKGFDERLLTFYITDEAKREGDFQLMAFTDDKIDNNHSDRCYLAPTLQMAMKWLRNTFHLEIYPFHDAVQEDNDWWYRIELHSKGCILTEHESDVIYKTYEQACEEAIKYCLEHLI